MTGKVLLPVAVAYTLPEQYSMVAKCLQRQALRSSRRIIPSIPRRCLYFLGGQVEKERK
jgi:hypothetical protein